jgi:hypothetical protein
VVAENLAKNLGTQMVSVFPQSTAAGASYRVMIDVIRFDSAPGKSATPDAVWTVRNAKEKSFRAGRTTVSEPVSDGSTAGLVGAHNRALGRLSVEVAEAIRGLEHGEVRVSGRALYGFSLVPAGALVVAKVLSCPGTMSPVYQHQDVECNGAHTICLSGPCSLTKIERRKVMRRSGVCLLILSGILLFVSPAVAHQSLIDTVATGCKDELEKYCVDVTPGDGRVLACLYAYGDKLSGKCEWALYDASVQLQRQ